MAYVVANTTCSTALLNGTRVRLRAGVLHSTDEPIVQQRPDLFDRLDSDSRVEQTTKAPGEKRNSRTKPKS